MALRFAKSPFQSIQPPARHSDMVEFAEGPVQPTGFAGNAPPLAMKPGTGSASIVARFWHWKGTTRSGTSRRSWLRGYCANVGVAAAHVESSAAWAGSTLLIVPLFEGDREPSCSPPPRARVSHRPGARREAYPRPPRGDPHGPKGIRRARQRPQAISRRGGGDREGTRRCRSESSPARHRVAPERSEVRLEIGRAHV